MLGGVFLVAAFVIAFVASTRDARANPAQRIPFLGRPLTRPSRNAWLYASAALCAGAGAVAFYGDSYNNVWLVAIPLAVGGGLPWLAHNMKVRR